VRVPDRLSREEIWAIAEEFRNHYVKPTTTIPVPIEDIIEFDLGIPIIPLPGLMQQADIDGFLSNDLKTIYIDNDVCNNTKWGKRYRFTCAHEIGHLVIHRDIIKDCNFQNANEWKKFRNEFPEDLLSRFEFQAYEFAGRLLVPLDKLIGKLDNLQPKINKFRAQVDDIDLLIEGVSKTICEDFDVSYKVIVKRIEMERLLGFFS
jgi:Zn-dependent peptidase ImmA (M78 family)